MTESRHYGVWRISTDWTAPLAVELEHLGFSALWIGGVNDSELRVAEELLPRLATSRWPAGS